MTWLPKKHCRCGAEPDIYCIYIVHRCINFNLKYLSHWLSKYSYKDWFSCCSSIYPLYSSPCWPGTRERSHKRLKRTWIILYYPFGSWESWPVIIFYRLSHHVSIIAYYFFLTLFPAYSLRTLGYASEVHYRCLGKRWTCWLQLQSIRGTKTRVHLKRKGMLLITASSIAGQRFHSSNLYRFTSEKRMLVQNRKHKLKMKEERRPHLDSLAEQIKTWSESTTS